MTTPPRIKSVKVKLLLKGSSPPLQLQVRTVITDLKEAISLWTSAFDVRRSFLQYREAVGINAIRLPRPPPFSQAAPQLRLDDAQLLYTFRKEVDGEFDAQIGDTSLMNRLYGYSTYINVAGGGGGSVKIYVKRLIRTRTKHFPFRHFLFDIWFWKEVNYIFVWHIPDLERLSNLLIIFRYDCLERLKSKI